MPSESEVLEALKVVMDPDLRRDIVTLGFVKNVTIDGGAVAFDVELTTPACPVKEQLREQAKAAVAGLAGVSDVAVKMTAQVRGAAPKGTGQSLSGVRNIIAVASGKGGVGKSTVATNLAVALHRSGADVGLLDLDIYGPSIPRMMASDGALTQGPDGLIEPLEAHGLKLMSMGYLAGPDMPVVWRGPMASKMVQQFVTGVKWGELDYLVVDLPPGTGDIQITITQSASITGAVIVTTPQDVALEVSAKGLKMFEQVQVPVLGIVENMSHLACPHCNEEIRVFPGGRTEEVCQQSGVAYLGAIPLDPEAALGGDEGVPVLVRTPGSPAAEAFHAFAGRVAQQLSIVNVADAETAHRPRKVTIADPGMVIDWDDDVSSTYRGRDLRMACACAACIDEWTHEKKIAEANVSEDTTVGTVSPVGRYGLAINFTDGHSTGIYTFRRLRELAGLEA